MFRVINPSAATAATMYEGEESDDDDWATGGLGESAAEREAREVKARYATRSAAADAAKVREAERQAHEATEREEFFSQREKKAGKVAAADSDRPGESAAEEFGQDETAEAPGFDEAEVIARLRDLGEPKTFFGEEPLDRYKRLRDLEILRVADKMMEGQTDVFGAALRQAESGKLEEADEDEDAGDKDDESAAAKVGETEGFVLDWVKEMLQAWEQRLRGRSETERTSAEGKREMAQYRQSKQYLRPLVKGLRSGTLMNDIVSTLQQVVVLARQREYNEATNVYMSLAIGNQTWTVGCTMVTFHDRKNRWAIGEASIKHILNDETTRKYIQTFKRLVTLSQQLYPSEPSKFG